MSNPNKKKGTAAETSVVNYLVSNGIQAVRKALSGSNDSGDIQIRIGNEEVTLEVKAGKQTQNPNRHTLEVWMTQADVEAMNSRQQCWLVVKRYGRAIKDSDVWIRDPDGGMYHLYLDEFVAYLRTNFGTTT